MPLGGLVSAGVGAFANGVGGMIADEKAAPARAAADQAQHSSLDIINALAGAPPESRPLILQQYKQAGLLTPEMEASLTTGPSAMEGVKTDGMGVEAQKQALQQMQERAKTGMTASDRAALSNAQSQADVASNAKQQQILQQFQQRGQGGSGANLAAALSEQQGGANRNSQNALDIMGKSQQQALQAAAQAGQLGSGLENQEFGEQSAKAQAADQMNRFNVQNQQQVLGANTASRNQAQAGNLANAQNVSNQNVNLGNTEAARQRAGEQQDFNNAITRAGALTGQASAFNTQGNSIAQGQQNLYGGIGKSVGGALGAAYNQPKTDSKSQDLSEFGYSGGMTGTHNYKNGGHVSGHASVPGDDPRNDTVDAKLSPGEIVVPRSIAQTSLGDKLLDLLKHHHEIKTHLDGLEEKMKSKEAKKLMPNSKPMGFADGGMIPQQPMSINPTVVPPSDGYPPGTPQNVKDNFTPQEVMQHAAARQKFGAQQPMPQQPMDPSLAEKIGANMQQLSQSSPSGMAHGGMVPQKGSIDYLKHLMTQLNSKKSYADGTVNELDGVVPQPQDYPAPEIDPSLSQAPLQQGDIPSSEPMSKDDMELPEEETPASKKAKDNAKAADDEIEKASQSSDKSKDEDRSPASDSSDNSESDDDQMSDDLRPELPKSTKFDSSADALREAQKARLRNSYLQQLEEGGALMGAGISRTDPTAMINSIRQQKDRVDLPVKEFEEQVANQKNDGNSDYSKAYASAAASIMGIDPSKVEGMSANALDKIVPLSVKKQAQVVALQKAQLAAELKANEGEANRTAKSEEADKDRKNKLEAARISAEGREKAATKAQDSRNTQKQLDAEVNMEKAVGSSRTKPAVAQAQKDMYSADKALSIVKPFKNLNDMPKTQVALLNSEIGKIATGGVPQKESLAELNNPTLASKYAETMSKLINKPVGMSQEAFLKNQLTYLKDLSEISHKLVKSNVGDSLRSYKNRVSPEAYKNAVARHSDMLGLYTPEQESGISNVIQATGMSRENAINKLVDAGKLPKESLDY